VRISAFGPLLALVVGGCASPLVANWYLVNSPPTCEPHASPCLFLALWNPGHEPIDLGRIEVRGLPATGDLPASPKVETLAEGQLRTIPLGPFDCWLPIEVVPPRGRPIRIRGRPSALSRKVLERCSQTALAIPSE